jgi:hypothetical protein
MNTFLLIVHGLVGVALLGAVTHQAVSLVWGSRSKGLSFAARYARVNQRAFSNAVIVMCILGIVLGAIIYPYYRLNVRIPFEELQLGWAVGLFELKEHFAGIALGVLPMYAVTWRTQDPAMQRANRKGLSLLLAFVVWWDFVIGHVLNNIRGFF